MPNHNIEDTEYEQQAREMNSNAENLDLALNEAVRHLLRLKDYGMKGQFADKIHDFAELMQQTLSDEYGAMAYDVTQSIHAFGDHVPPVDDSEVGNA